MLRELLIRKWYRVFHGFGQVKLPYVTLPIFTIAPAAFKNDAWFKSDQIQLQNNHLASLI